MSCEPQSQNVRRVIDSPTIPVQILGTSRQRRTVRLKVEGPDNVYFTTSADGERSDGFLMTPIDPPLVIDIQTGLWMLAENLGSRSLVSCYTSIGEA